jgi:DNA-binding transcriptional LysR family regulator
MASEAPAIAIAGLRKKFEGISYKLRVLPAPQVTESVRSGSCDLGITYGLAPDIQLQTLYQLIEPVVVAMPLNHPLAQMKKVRLTELRNTPLALPDTDFGIREMIDRATRASGFEFEPVLSSNHFETLREFVRQGAGIALLPKRSAIPDQRRGQMCIVAVEDAVLEVATAAVITLKKRRLSKGTKLYVEELIKALQKLD